MAAARVKQEDACRIVAASLFRELTSSGYRMADLLAVTTELLDLVLRDAAGKRAGGSRSLSEKNRTGAGGHDGQSAPPDSQPVRGDDVSKHFENVVRFIRELDIDTRGITPESRLGADIGMDSQEIVELALLIEKSYGISVPERLLCKTSTVADTTAHIDRLVRAKSAPLPEALGFDFRCEARIIIARPCAEVYRALHRLEDWTRYLPHVVGLDILYDDGRYQEFKMRVASKTGTLEVRSIRDCDGQGAIDFFQPEPPRFLKHHAGGWRFSELDHGEKTEVVTFHEWRLCHEVAKEAFTGPVPYEEQVRELLLEHAKTALSLWKKVLEAGGSPRPKTSERPVPEASLGPNSSSRAAAP